MYTSGDRSRKYARAPSISTLAPWWIGRLTDPYVCASPELSTGQRFGERFRIERLQIADALAHADEMNGQPKAMSERDQYSALRRAVELGHDETCQGRGRLEGLDLTGLIMTKLDGRSEEHTSELQ